MMTPKEIMNYLKEHENREVIIGYKSKSESFPGFIKLMYKNKKLYGGWWADSISDSHREMVSVLSQSWLNHWSGAWIVPPEEVTMSLL